MARNQNRIEGEYAIVSVYSKHKGAIGNAAAHDNATMNLLDAGATVEFLKGKWNGTEEQSLRISGPHHAAHALRLAYEYDQEAFITVSGGAATLWVRGFDNYYPANRWDAMVEAPDATDDYTETRRGFRFQFTWGGV